MRSGGEKDLRLAVLEQDAAFALAEGDLAVPLGRKHGAHLGEGVEDELVGVPAQDGELRAPDAVATRAERAKRQSVAEDDGAAEQRNGDQHVHGGLQGKRTRKSRTTNERPTVNVAKK